MLEIEIEKLTENNFKVSVDNIEIGTGFDSYLSAYEFYKSSFKTT